MKLTSFLERMYVPALKCDAVSAGITAGASLIGNLVSSSDASDNLNAQREENERNRQFNSQEAQKARVWSTNERLAAQQYNTSEREATQAYNKANFSPAAIVSQMRGAGINPAVYGQSSVMATPSSPMSSSPGSGSSASFNGGVTPQVSQIPQLISSGADLVNALSKSDETKGSLKLMDAEVKNYIAKTKGQELANDLSELELEVGKSIKDSRVQKAIKEVMSLETQIKLFGSEIDKNKAESKLMKAQRRLTKELEGKTEQEKLQALIFTNRYNEIISAQIEKDRTQSQANRAQANESNASAEQTKIFNKIYGDQRFKHSLISQCVTASQKAIEDKKLTKSQADHMNYMVQQAAFATDMQEFTYWSNQINSFVNTIGSVASQYYGAGALRELINLRKAMLTPATPIKGFTP